MRGGLFEGREVMKGRQNLRVISKRGKLQDRTDDGSTDRSMGVKNGKSLGNI